MIRFWVRFLVVLFFPALLAGGITVTGNNVTLQYPQSIRFELAAASDVKIEKVTLLYGTDAQTCQAGDARRIIEFTPATEISVNWEWELKRSGILPPGAQLWWQWEIVDASGARLTTERKTLVINDPRSQWQSLEKEGITVQWYQGDAAFGKMILDTAQKSRLRLSNDLGIRPSRPIWITVYPTVEEVRAVLLHTYDWTGAVAFSEYGSIILPAVAEEKSWIESVIPHELTHVLVGELVFNCRGVDLPTWLSEGLAELAEGGPDQATRQKVSQALKAGTLTDLRSIARGFPAQSENANLAYAQSAMVVDYLIQKYGPQKMGELLASMQAGLTGDEALTKIYVLDTDKLEFAWRASLGFLMPTKIATAVQKTNTPLPTLALYTAVVRPTAAQTASPTVLLPTPAPTQTSEPVRSPSPPPGSTPVPPPKGGLPFCGGALAIPFVVLFGLACLRLRR